MRDLRKMVTLALSCGAFSVFAQELPKNNVKLNLLQFVGKTISVEYERALNNNFSINGTVALMPKGALPFSSSFSSVVDDSSIIEDTKLGAFSLAVEGRYYTSKTKDVMQGFYLAPFVKYSKYDLNTLIEYTAVDVDSQLPVSGNINAFSGGLAVGLQWIFSNRISLDWRIIGLSYGVSNGTIEGSKVLTAAEQEDIRGQLNDLAADLPILKLESDVNAQGVKSTLKGPWAGIRTGLAIGYSF